MADSAGLPPLGAHQRRADRTTLEDIETHHGTEDTAAEKVDSIVNTEGAKARFANCGRLSTYLPCEEVIIEPLM